MGLQFLDAQGDGAVLDLVRRVPFHLEDKHRLGIFLRLFEVLIERRDGFAVLQAVVLEFGIGSLVDAFAVDMGVVKDEQHAVGGHVDIEFAAPETGFLRAFERCERVAGVAAGFAVPVAAVGYDGGGFLLSLCQGYGCRCQDGSEEGFGDQCGFHIDYIFEAL